MNLLKSAKGAARTTNEVRNKFAPHSVLRVFLKWIGGALLAASAFAQPAAPSQTGEVEILHVRKNIYLLTGAGGNITMSIGPDGIFLVDAGYANMSDKVLAAINNLSRQLSTAGQPDIGRASTQTDSLHRQYACPCRPYRWQREDRQSGQDLYGRQRHRRPGRGHGRRGDSSA